MQKSKQLAVSETQVTVENTCPSVLKFNTLLCELPEVVSSYYCMAGSESGQDEANRSCVLIGYPSGQDGSILPAPGFPALFPRKRNCLKPAYIAR